MSFRVFASALLLPASLIAQKPKNSSDIVLRLYKDFAWETLIDEPLNAGRGFSEQPKEVLSRYLDDSLTSMLLAERACAGKNGECGLSFLPLWAAQDVGATYLKVLPTADPTLVIVKFRFANGGGERTLRFRMVQTRRGWRVHDIVYDEGPSLRDILRGG